MPTVTFDKKRVLGYVGDITDAELSDRISMLGTDLESVTPDSITVEIFPNRTDMLSEEGFGHAIANFIGHGTGFEDVAPEASDYELDVDPKMTDVRPYTVAAVATGTRLDDESLRALIQLQEKLHLSYGRKRAKAAIGIYPMERIAWPISFTAERPSSIVFTPLDGEKGDANAILERHPAGKAYGHLLRGHPFFPVFRDAEGKVLSVPPIINSEETGRVTTATTDLFIEVSGHHLATLEKTLAIVCFTLQKRGAQLHSVTVHYPDRDLVTPRIEPQRVPADPKQIARILGFEPKGDELIGLLAKMGLGYDAQSGEALVPTYRTDVLHPVDVAEDLAIAYGYENFEPDLPALATIAQEHPLETFKRKASVLLAGFGYQETQTYHLIPAAIQRELAKTRADIVEIANPMNREYDTLRTTVLLSLLDVLARNRSAAMPRNVYEIGRVFIAGADTETGVSEHDELAVALEDDEASFSTAQQIVAAVLERYRLSYEFMETATDTDWWHSLFVPGRRAHVVCDRHVIGEIGEVHPDVLRTLEIYHPIVGVRLNIEEAFRIANR